MPGSREVSDRARYRRQVEYLFERSPLYREKLTATGFPDSASVGDLDDLAQLPFTTKDELRASQAEHPPLGAHLAARPEDLTRIYSTSGSTGLPVYIAVTDGDLQAWLEIGSRTYSACGVRSGQRVVITYNAGPFVAGAAIDSFARIGATLIPVGTGNTERLVRACQRLGVDAVACTPSYALYLAEWCSERDIDPSGLGISRFAVAGEPGGGEPGIRSRIERSFDARVCEAMGIGDAAPSLWGECDEQAGMHWSGRDFLHVELVEPETGEPLSWEHRAEGELVYTALQREAMPVLRFRSRDRAVVNADPCPCGRPGVRVRCIGRTDDMITVRGVNLFPTAVRSVIERFGPRTSGAILLKPKRGGVRQDVAPAVQVELSDGVDPDPALAKDIERAIRSTLVVATEVELVAHGTLARSEYKTPLVDYSEAAPAEQ